MSLVKRQVSTAGLVLFAVAFSFGQQRLLVVGGGERPPDAVRKFVEWAGGAKARILIITWSTAEPDASFEALAKNFAPHAPSRVEHAATRPLEGDKRIKFIEQLREATAVFFSGGDQNRIMDVLKDEELLKLVRERYARGVPFGGTSAGAAVMSDPMMTGEADLKILDGTKVGIRPGVGLIPDVLFDQHFLVRQRHNRLFGLVMVSPKMLGIGIDEDTAVLIEDNRRLTVSGTSYVMFVQPRTTAGITYEVAFLRSGGRFDLKKRKPF